MKKQSHAERLAETKKSISKVKVKSKNRMKPSTKRWIGAGVGVAVIAGAATGIGIGVHNSMNADKRIPFAVDDASFNAERNAKRAGYDAAANTHHTKSGSATITTVKAGGAKIISNYKEMFSDEKIQDLATWFYNDVSWGPEISTLNSINLMSGVQKELGTVTLGYHTTSRDGSVIVMSPDVIFQGMESDHKYQSTFYALTQSPAFHKYWYDAANAVAGADYIADDTATTKDLLYRRFSTITSDNMVDKTAQPDLYKLELGMYQIKGLVQLILNNGWQMNPDDLSESASHILATLGGKVKAEAAKATTTADSLAEFITKQFVAMYPVAMTDDPKNPGQKIEDKSSPSYKSVVPIRAAFAGLGKERLAATFESFSEEPVLSMLSAKSTRGWHSYPNREPAHSGFDLLNTKDTHDKTLVNELRNGNEEQEKLALNSLFISKGIRLSGSSVTSDEKIQELADIASALLSGRNYQFGDIDTINELNGKNFKLAKIGNQDPGFSTTYAALLTLNAKLKTMSLNDLTNITPQNFLDILSSYKLSQGSRAEYDAIIDKNTKAFTVAGTALSKRLQNTIHPGEMIADPADKTKQVRKPGVHSYVDDDTVYDSYIRRMMTDMEYTIAHEYGHHTTMYHAQDIADSTDTMVNAEVLTTETDTTLTSKRKYDIIKNIFSKGFQQSLKDSTDGDTRTDILKNTFQGDVTVGDLGKQWLKYKAGGIENWDYDGIKVSIPKSGMSGTDHVLAWPIVSGRIGINVYELIPDYLVRDADQPNYTDAELAKVIAYAVDKEKNPYIEGILKETYKTALADKAAAVAAAKTAHKTLSDHLTGLDVWNAFIKNAAAQTRDFFDKTVGGKNAFVTVDGGKTLEEEVGNKNGGFNTQITLFDNIQQYIARFLALAHLRTDAKPTVKEVSDWFKSGGKVRGDTFEQYINKEYGSQVGADFKFSQGFYDYLGDLFSKGIYANLRLESRYSPASAIYVFNKPGDEAKYGIKLTTIAPGSNAPKSFARYQTTYAETLTRILQQMTFNVDAELLTNPGEYYNGDMMRFAMYGDDLYNLVDRGIAGSKQDGSMTQEGKDAIHALQKYFGMDASVSAIHRDAKTGLFQVFGYLPDATDADKAARPDGLVFEDQDGNVVQEVDTIYNVDNFHYYEKHGDTTTSKGLAAELGKVSWETNFFIGGDFSNSKLREGTYKMAFWTDANGDGKVQKSELKEITNGEVSDHGIINANGRADYSAEFQGNPDLDAASEATKATDAEQFEFKVTDIPF